MTLVAQHAKPGDHVATEHDCQGLGGSVVRHDVPVLVTAVDQCVAGTRIRGVRCDGTGIEWIEELPRTAAADEVENRGLTHRGEGGAAAGCCPGPAAAPPTP